MKYRNTRKYQQIDVYIYQCVACMGSVLGPCFVMFFYVVSFLVLQSSYTHTQRERERERKRERERERERA